jgi:hypothetical protein
LLNLIAASNDARYSVIEAPRSRVRLQIPHHRERGGSQYTSIRWPSGSRHERHVGLFIVPFRNDDASASMRPSSARTSAA